MTKASSSPRPASPEIQTTRAASNEYDTLAEAAAAAAAATEARAPPSSLNLRVGNDTGAFAATTPETKDIDFASVRAEMSAQSRDAISNDFLKVDSNEGTGEMTMKKNEQKMDSLKDFLAKSPKINIDWGAYASRPTPTLGSGGDNSNNNPSSFMKKAEDNNNGGSTGNITTRSTITATNFFPLNDAMTNLCVSSSSSSSEEEEEEEEDPQEDATLPPSIPDPEDGDECVLCCYPLPLKEKESCYMACCGELICNGCITAQQRTLIIGTNVKKPIAGSKEEELEFLTIISSEQRWEEECPFCRAKASANDREYLKRIWKRIDEYKDPKALLKLGRYYMRGEHGLSKNLTKAKEFYQQSYDLGNPLAAHYLVLLYTTHTPDQARMMECLEEGVQRGNRHCINDLAIRAAQSGNHEEAKRQFMTGARSGDDVAMHNVMLIYRTPGSVVSKDDLATTLRAHKAANDKVKSEPREYAIRHHVFEKKWFQQENGHDIL